MTIQNMFATHDHGGPHSYQELLDQDGDQNQGRLRIRGETDVGPIEIPTSWYLDKNIHDLEVDRIWKKVWQVACRADDIPVKGDTWVYDIAGISLIIVRSEQDEIRAFYNSCLHRGAALRPCSGRVNSLQCPFHGFTWSLQGELRQVPCPEQFPDLDPEAFRLPEVKVELWAGFVFVNLDPEAGPLADFLGSFGEEFVRNPLNNRLKVAHVHKIVGANWKVAQEAFMEGYHVFTTHPQNIPIASNECVQHDVFGNYCRGILGRGVPSEYMKVTPTEQEKLDVGLSRWLDEPELPPLKDGQTARQRIAEVGRERLRPILPDLVDQLSDAEFADTVYYTLFPNFHPMGTLTGPMVYLFRPYGDDHTRSIMDILIIVPRGSDDTSTPDPLHPTEIGENEPFSKDPRIGLVGPFLNQDIANLSNIMSGLRNNQRGKVIFARDHELMIRHFYALYMEKMGFEGN